MDKTYIGYVLISGTHTYHPIFIEGWGGVTSAWRD